MRMYNDPHHEANKMKRKRLAGIAVILAAAGLIIWRASRTNAPNSHDSAQHQSAHRPTVVLFADLREADEIPGCGEIIKAVRDAASRGIVTRELDANHDAAKAREYKVLVAPSLLIFDNTGKEIGRFEGESHDTIATATQAINGLHK